MKMKKYILTLMFSMLCGVMPALALSRTIDGVTYEVLDEKEMTVTVKACEDFNNYVDLEIPSQVSIFGKNYTVVDVSDKAFSKVSYLRSVKLPNTVKRIGNEAFYARQRLEEVSIGAGVEEIGYFAFANCVKIKEIKLPEDLKKIGQSAFSGCTSLEIIRMPDSVIQLGQECFKECTGLKYFWLSKGITRIEKETFYNCTSLVYVDIPMDVSYIGLKAFYKCSLGTHVRLPDSLKVLEQDAFAFNENITEITIPHGVTELGVHAFYGCNAMTTVYYNAENATSGMYSVFPSSVTNVTIGEGVKSLPGDLFKDCKNLTTLTYKAKRATSPAGMYYALFSRALSDITIAPGVESIPCNFANYCASLTKITLPASVTSIGDFAFTGSALKEVHCQNPLPPVVGNEAFNELKNCTLYVPYDSKIHYAEAAGWRNFADIQEEQASYKPVLTEGRSWRMSIHSLDLSKDENDTLRHIVEPFTAYVNGSYMDNGRKIYKIDTDMDFWGDDSYEENGRIYAINYTTCMFGTPVERLFFDMYLKKGDEFFGFKVKDVDSIMVNGELHKRISFGIIGYIGVETYFVEGMGMNDNLMLMYEGNAANNGFVQWLSLDEVYDNGECIFRADDFGKEAYDPTKDDAGDDNGYSIWNDGTEWDVHYVSDNSDSGEVISGFWTTYSVKSADNGYVALYKTVTNSGLKGKPELQGYIRNDGDSVVYVRPVMEDGSVGEECLLYDFRQAYEYGGYVRYGQKDGNIVEKYIDWRTDSLDYYAINNNVLRCVPAWNDVVYRYGYLAGPMELFLMKEASGKTKRPKPTNISHVIFTTKGGHKKAVTGNGADDGVIAIPYDQLLTSGTVWECLAVSVDNPDAAHSYTIEVVGDTLIGSRLCKVVCSSENDARMVLFEEGRKVYVVNSDNSAEVLLDFGVQNSDRLGEETFVADLKTIENQGFSYRSITIDTGMDCSSAFAYDTTPWAYDLIEGVGVSKDEHLANHRFLPGSGTVSYLLNCWKNGTLVYHLPGYDAAGIKDVRDNTAPILYDIFGRRIKTAPRKGLYINGNRKVLSVGN